jgi:F-type H+-transporting ATPase subunit delta
MGAGVIARRYAKGLFDQAAKDPGQIDLFSNSLEKIAQLFSLKAAYTVFQSPVFPKALKIEILDYALGLDVTGSPMGNFIRLVIESGREMIIPDIKDQFNLIRDDFFGCVRGTLIASSHIDHEFCVEIEEVLSVLLKKKVSLSFLLDPGLLGGFQVKVGYKILDLSLKSQLESLTLENARL